jgi:hypothetical protein
MTSYPNDQGNPAGAIPVYIAPGSASSGYTPAAGAAVAIVTGGTAVTVFSGPINGAVIVNPPNAAAQGIATAESLYISMVGTPGSTDAGANGTTIVLAAGASYTFPALASAVTVKANAATTGHKFTAIDW